MMDNIKCLFVAYFILRVFVIGVPDPWYDPVIGENENFFKYPKLPLTKATPYVLADRSELGAKFAHSLMQEGVIKPRTARRVPKPRVKKPEVKEEENPGEVKTEDGEERTEPEVRRIRRNVARRKGKNVAGKPAHSRRTVCKKGSICRNRRNRRSVSREIISAPAKTNEVPIQRHGAKEEKEVDEEEKRAEPGRHPNSVPSTREKALTAAKTVAEQDVFKAGSYVRGVVKNNLLNNFNKVIGYSPNDKSEVENRTLNSAPNSEAKGADEEDEISKIIQDYNDEEGSKEEKPQVDKRISRGGRGAESRSTRRKRVDRDKVDEEREEEEGNDEDNLSLFDEVVNEKPKITKKRGAVIRGKKRLDEDDREEELDEDTGNYKSPKHPKSNRRRSYPEQDEDGSRIRRGAAKNFLTNRNIDDLDTLEAYEDEEEEEPKPTRRRKREISGNGDDDDDDDANLSYEKERRTEEDSYDDEGDEDEEFNYDRAESDDTQNENDDDEDDEEYTKKFKTPSGLEYLGAGYDLIKGNPLGDEITLLDPGYKSTVIQMHWNKNIENISNSLLFLQPVGGWIRPYSSCHKVETVTEINSSDSLLKSLSADASVSLDLPGDSVKFSASAKYKKLDDVAKSSNTKMFINRSYCFKYVAGMSTSLEWFVWTSDIVRRDFTLGFQSSLERLIGDFRGLDRDSRCKPYIYREDPKNEHCEEMGVSDWMELFNTFGTHVATKIYLGTLVINRVSGGKIFTTLEVKKNQEKKLADQGMDIKAMLSAQIVESSVDSNVKVSVVKSNDARGNLLDTKKSTFVLGGDIYGSGKVIDFAAWSKSVADHAMPIKAEFTPISHFMSKELEEAYKAAYLYYGKVILESDFLRYQTQMQMSAEEMMKDMDIEHSQGKLNVKIGCKDGRLIQFGFMILSLKDKSHEVVECPIHASECYGPAREDVLHATVWIACRAHNLMNLKQVVTRDKDPGCDSGYNILLGSYFFDSKSNYLLMNPCKLGEKRCATDDNVDFSWLVCTKKFWDLSSKSKVVKKNKSSTVMCTQGETVAFGMSIEWVKNGDGTSFANFAPCKRGEPSCLHTCQGKCNRIVQYIVCN